MLKILKNTFFQIILFNVAVLIAANFFIYDLLETFVLDDLRADFEKKVALARPQLDLNALEREDHDQLKDFADRMKSLTHLRITILNRQGKVLADSDVPIGDLVSVDNHLTREEIQQALMHGAGIASRRSKTIDEELIYYSETIRKSGKIIGFFRTAIFMPDVNAKISFIRRLIFKTDIIFILLIMITLGFLLINYRNKLSVIRKELSQQRAKNRIQDLAYHEDHELNKLLREINKTLSWSQDRLSDFQFRIDQLKNILNSIASGVMAFSQQGQILFVNDAFRNIFRIEEATLESQEIYKCIHFPPLIRDIEIFLSDQTLTEINNSLKFYDETYIEYRIFRQKIWRMSEQGYLLTVRDITRLQQLERVRSDFVANVSHEFKTPLSSIRGYAETLLSGSAQDKDTQIKFLKKIERQTIRLEHMVSDILQLAKIEKKDISDMKKINMTALMREIIEEFILITSKKDLILELDVVDPERKIIIEANPDLVRTIIANLLSNAVQYNSPDGRINTRLYAEQKYCVIEVEDTGIGISEQEVDRIFERFYRTNDARIIFTEGTGLGLSIVKNAVESLNGQIEVSSKLGKGTSISVKIPLAKS